jgi:hypothetical protein
MTCEDRTMSISLNDYFSFPFVLLFERFLVAPLRSLCCPGLSFGCSLPRSRAGSPHHGPVITYFVV